MEVPGCSTGTTGSVKRRRGRNLTTQAFEIIKNVYDGIRARNMASTTDSAVELCSALTKVSCRSVYRAIKNNGPVSKAPKQETRGRKRLVLDMDTKYAIRRKVHGFYFKNELPTLKKIISAIGDDVTMPNVSRKVLLRTLHEMNFRYVKRSRKSWLIEKQEIVLWRRRYLEKIRQFRSEGKKIYYMDETWLNEGHTVLKVWQDLNVTSSRQAFMEGFSTGLKAPSGKGRRLIVTHIGSDSGFLENGLLMFESRSTGDYHEEMNADVFENWFTTVLTHVEAGSVIVMDNAPYHSRRTEKLPTSAWRKGQIMDWLKEKNIDFDETMLKVQILDIARRHKDQYLHYAVDEMARESGVTVLRLPPYHCEFNPIELIWAQVKGEVARKNTTFKLHEAKSLLLEAVANVTAENWSKCIVHVQKEEQRIWDLDIHVEVIVEPLVISPGDSSSDSEISDMLCSDLSDGE